MSGGGMPSSALCGLRVVEIAHERICFAGKLLADMGAEVIVVEPPGGDRTRGYPPFLDDRPGPERSLYWWHYNTSKLSVTLDLDAPSGRELFAELVETADVVIESEDPGRMAELSLDYPDLANLKSDIIVVSMTPFGRQAPGDAELVTDLTLLAGGGPVWMCGYDDHSLPPVRGGGNQGYHTGCHYAVLSALTAILVRDATGRGQHCDVNMHAAANVTTEYGSYGWLVARETVLRQTGRHAGTTMTMESQIQCADGRWANTGVPPRSPQEFRNVRDWIVELGLEGEFPEIFMLEMGMEKEFIDIGLIGKDEETTALFAAGRDAMTLIAKRVSAYEFFHGAQSRGIALGVIYSPEEVMEDPHFVERGFPTEVLHEDLGRTFTYPGAPYKFEKTPWRIARRAPHVGEHNLHVFGALGRTPADLETLRADGVV